MTVIRIDGVNLASIFVSHSSKDDYLADQFGTWLNSEGFSDFFIDHSSISGGETWANALRANSGACRVVVCLVTPNWLKSGECPAEFKAAWYMGKRIIPLFIIDDENSLSVTQREQLKRVQAEAQGFDLRDSLSSTTQDLMLSPDQASALKKGLRQAGALASIGLDPEAFEIDADIRPCPFPGLGSFGDEDADAAIFFGRSREIAEVLEELRAMRAVADKRPLVILGASGAGKSSLIKAGVIPRLRRESVMWLPLRAMRPLNDPLLHFSHSLTSTLADYGVRLAPGLMHQNLLQQWQNADRLENGNLTEKGARQLSKVLDEISSQLHVSANRPNSSILISVDQAEELAQNENQSSSAFIDYLNVAIESGSHWKVTMTVRTDMFSKLQSHPRFRDLKIRGYDLRTVPTFRFDDIAEHPAARYGVQVSPELTDALMMDTPGEDTLPLLAFTLQRLWNQYAQTKCITLQHYYSIGGISGLIESSAEYALSGCEPEQFHSFVPTSPIPEYKDQLGAETFVPPLADVNAEGRAVRRVANWSDFSEPEQELLDLFARWRLVVKKNSNIGSRTVEVAHEALFREWSRLKGWLEPERIKLESLRGLKIAAANWSRKKKHTDFLIHFGKRLSEADALRLEKRYSIHISEVDNQYLEAALNFEEKKSAQRRNLKLLTAFSFTLVAVSYSAYLNRADISRVWNSNLHFKPYSKSASDLAALPSGNPFQDCIVNSDFCPIMVKIPAGVLTTNSPVDRTNGTPDFHKIDSFAVSKYEITVEEYSVCANMGKCPNNISDELLSTSNGHPMVSISWNEATDYTKWLSQMTGQKYRLLSDIEWEYSARAKVKPSAELKRFSWGDDDPVCEADKTNGAAFSGCKKSGTWKVGSFPANNFGLHDMHGNVWEWTADCFDQPEKDPVRSPSVLTTSVCDERSYRGGSWGFDSEFLVISFRDGLTPDYRGTGLGFRVAREIEK